MRLKILGLVCASVVFFPAPAAQSELILSEFMASNRSTLADQDGDYSDWIEIFNPGNATVNLDGWHVSDNAGDLTKWRFPNVNLGANGYLVIFASGKDRRAAGGELHTNFRLDAEGEYLALTRPDGVVATEFAPSYPEQFPDISYGGGGNYFETPTPGRANGSGFFAFVEDLKFSQERGFYEGPFTLTISTRTEGAQIRYTTNGMPPTATSGLVYNGPIQISGTTSLRAAGFKAGYSRSKIETQTYLFLEDVIRQSANRQPPPGWPSSWGSNMVDYGMDPRVVDSPVYRETIKDDLKTIPTFSVVTDLRHLFDSATGIYANPHQDGRNWERPCSFELINPDGSKGFQVNAGIRIRGGFSRSTSNPKHAFRLFFRGEYGDSKLKYPLFGDAGTDTFDKIDLRTFQNYSWSFQGDPSGVFIRDQFSRDTQLEMGHQAERGNYYHLYINGVYWGLFNTCERPEAAYAATYYGGKREDYDVIKVEAGPYTINATDGDMNAWTRLYNLARSGFESEAAYQRVQGRNPDGTMNPAYENLIDIENLIDYMLVIFYGGNLDAPISNFLGNSRPNNWYGVRDRTGRDGFRFFAHDAEHTLLNVNENRLGPYSSGDTSVLYSNPQWIFQKLTANAEFRLKVGDHARKHFFNGGALTPESVTRRFMARKDEIDRAVVGESARWGDAKRSTPLTRADWLNAINNIANNYLPRRSDIVLGQLRGRGLYPAIAAPAFNQHGGNVEPGFSLSMSGGVGTLYYTMDGTEPRLAGDKISPKALVYSGPIQLNESAEIKARMLSGGSWSALNEASFTLIQTFQELYITEIMYHPPAEGETDGDEFEFLELKNVGTEELDLSGVHFTRGIRFTFPNGTRVGPGEFMVLAGNPAEFSRKYPGTRVDGVYTGRLSNSGETLTLAHAIGTPIFSVTYGDEIPWPESADGKGFSLVPVNPNVNEAPMDPGSWRASTNLGGSPGRDDPSSNIAPVWITEILTHTDLPEVDAVELHNPNAVSVDVSFWYLTDRRATPKKFRIPEGTIIPAGGYLVFTEADFNANPGMNSSFTFSSRGEEVYLFSGNAAGELTGFSDGFSFGPAANGVSFGRYSTSTGAIDYPAQSAKTLGGENAGPLVGPVVINEIQYDPLLGEDEFVELMNISGHAVKLYDPEHPQNSWRINGIGFSFPGQVEIPAGGIALVAGADPISFRARNNVPPSVPIFGPFAGVLQNSGERLQLLRPDKPDLDAGGNETVSYIVVDQVRYSPLAPWPPEAAGTGASLERIQPGRYGNDPVNWRASPGPASPGLDNSGNRMPRVNAGIDRVFQTEMLPLSAPLSGTATDDGQPNPPGTLAISWTQLTGPGNVVFENAKEASTTALLPGFGTYRLRLSAHDGELEATSEIEISVEQAPAELTMIPKGSVWKYLDNGSNQGTAWRAVSFDDASWKSGPAKLGYGEGNEATVVGFGPNAANKYVTTYFRHAFPVSAPQAIKSLNIRLQRDDGAVVYLNGTEVFRSNMPTGTISFTTYASSVVGGVEETAFYEQEVDPSLLRLGKNVIAVEVHQVNAGSSDLSFDLELAGTSVPENRPPLVNAGNDVTVTFPGPAVLSGSASDDGLPVPPGRLVIAWSKVSGPGEVFFDNVNAATTSATFAAPGVYVLRLKAHDGAYEIPDDVTVTVVSGAGESFAEWKARHFGEELGNPAISGDDADPDGDGHTNREEFLSGTDPKDPRSVLQASALPVSGGNVTIRFEAMGGRSYSVQARDSLETGEWIEVGEVGPEIAQRMVSLTYPVIGNGRYYRIVVRTD